MVPDNKKILRIFCQQLLSFDPDACCFGFTFSSVGRLKTNSILIIHGWLYQIQIIVQEVPPPYKEMQWTNIGCKHQIF